MLPTSEKEQTIPVKNNHHNQVIEHYEEKDKEILVPIAITNIIKFLSIIGLKLLYFSIKYATNTFA
ncbi:hypothetical protein C2G38_2228084 [Gigaspora rosea]|uniref:Uncharacterized protein n=1 Tax=Gigaspora rosea TaxID=44941 RepID=A0A397TWB2_9GLOM|nr:hypothetical protein C2G38_2228084 [Gigaspora rosea]